MNSSILGKGRFIKVVKAGSELLGKSTAICP